MLPAPSNLAASPGDSGPTAKAPVKPQPKMVPDVSPVAPAPDQAAPANADVGSDGPVPAEQPAAPAGQQADEQPGTAPEEVTPKPQPETPNANTVPPAAEAAPQEQTPAKSAPTPAAEGVEQSKPVGIDQLRKQASDALEKGDDAAWEKLHRQADTTEDAERAKQAPTPAMNESEIANTKAHYPEKYAQQAIESHEKRRIAKAPPKAPAKPATSTDKTKARIASGPQYNEASIDAAMKAGPQDKHEIKLQSAPGGRGAVGWAARINGLDPSKDFKREFLKPKPSGDNSRAFTLDKDGTYEINTPNGRKFVTMKGGALMPTDAAAVRKALLPEGAIGSSRGPGGTVKPTMPSDIPAGPKHDQFARDKHPETGEEMYGPPPAGMSNEQWAQKVSTEMMGGAGHQKSGTINDRMRAAKAKVRGEKKPVTMDELKSRIKNKGKAPITPDIAHGVGTDAGNASAAKEKNALTDRADARASFQKAWQKAYGSRPEKGPGSTAKSEKLASPATLATPSPAKVGQTK